MKLIGKNKIPTTYLKIIHHLSLVTMILVIIDNYYPIKPEASQIKSINTYKVVDKYKTTVHFIAETIDRKKFILEKVYNNYKQDNRIQIYTTPIFGFVKNYSFYSEDNKLLHKPYDSVSEYIIFPIIILVILLILYFRMSIEKKYSLLVALIIVSLSYFIVLAGIGFY